MDQDALAQLEQTLRARERQLVDAGDLSIDPVRTDPVAAPDEDEQPLTEMNQAIASRRNRDRSRELSLVREALHKIEREPDDFGLCEACEEPISVRRLALPWARFCIRCKSANEDPVRGRRRHAGDLD